MLALDMANVSSQMTRSLVSLVDAEGRDADAAFSLDADLASKRADGRLEFGFEYRGIPFVVRARAENQKTVMELRADLGHLPFTAESPGRRATALAILDSATSTLGGRLRLSRKQRVVMEETFNLNSALTPAVLLTKTAEAVLRVRPYLELLALVVPPPIEKQPAVN